MKKALFTISLVVAMSMQVDAQERLVLEGATPNQKKTQLAEFGKPAIPFSQADPSGKQISLASLKGKYVLLTFWRSTDKASREEQKSLIKSYEKLKKKNFEIVSVSLDDNKVVWENAVKTDGLPWIHLCDLQGTKNKIVLDYRVKDLPQNFLISPDGKFLGPGGSHGQDLLNDLDALVDQKLIMGKASPAF